MNTVKINQYIDKLGAFNRALVRMSDSYHSALDKLNDNGFSAFAQANQVDLKDLLKKAHNELHSDDYPALQQSLSKCVSVLMDFYEEYQVKCLPSQDPLWAEFSVVFNYLEMMTHEYIWQREMASIELRLVEFPYDIMQLCLLTQYDTVRPEDCLDEIIFSLEQDLYNRNMRLSSVSEKLKLAADIKKYTHNVHLADKRKTFEGELTGPLKRFVTNKSVKNWDEYKQSSEYARMSLNTKRMLESTINTLLMHQDHVKALSDAHLMYADNKIHEIAEELRGVISNGLYDTRHIHIRSLKKFIIGEGQAEQHHPDNLKIKKTLDQYRNTSRIISACRSAILPFIAGTVAVLGLLYLMSYVHVAALCTFIIGVAITAVALADFKNAKSVTQDLMNSGQLTPVAAAHLVQNAPRGQSVMAEMNERETVDVLERQVEIDALQATR